MKYHITHKTWYTYADLAPVCHNLVHLAPRNRARQACTRFALAIEPEPSILTNRLDCFGNRADYFSIESVHQKLEIVAESVVDVQPPELDMGKARPWEECVIRQPAARTNGSPVSAIDPILWQLTFPSPRVPHLAELRDYARKSFRPKRPMIEAVAELTTRIHSDFQFDSRATSVDTSIHEVLELRRGVCQDFAHLAVGCLRAMGFSARYTSGYVRTLAPPGKQRLIGADASHAWCGCWCGPLGWVDIDPTNNCLVGDSYVTIAWGRDYGDVCPIQGVFVGQGEHQIGVSVDVAPCAEDAFNARS